MKLDCEHEDVDEEKGQRRGDGVGEDISESEDIRESEDTSESENEDVRAWVRRGRGRGRKRESGKGREHGQSRAFSHHRCTKTFIKI